MSTQIAPIAITHEKTKAQMQNDARKRWQKKMLKQNRCRQCGVSKYRSPYAQLCVKCARKKRVQRRRRDQHKPWKPGKPGKGPMRP